MKHMIPKESEKQQLRFMGLVGKVVEGFCEEGRFEVSGEGCAGAMRGGGRRNKDGRGEVTYAKAEVRGGPTGSGFCNKLEPVSLCLTGSQTLNSKKDRTRPNHVWATSKKGGQLEY